MTENRTILLGLIVGALLAAGCVPEPPEPEPPSDDDDATEPNDGGLPDVAASPYVVPSRACEIPLSISTEWPAAQILGLLHVTVQGGSGDATVALVEGPSGSIFQSSVGTYIAGNVAGVTDRLIAWDHNCFGEASLDIEVVTPLAVRPTGGELLPGDAFTFEVVGGSGDTTFAAVDLRSGGTLGASGVYSAGSSEGIDEAEAFDERTGVMIAIEMTVRTTAALTPEPAHIMAPVGTVVDLLVDGGSGWIDLTSDQPGLVTLDSSTSPPNLVGVAEGRVLLQADDMFSSITTDIIVDIVDTRTAVADRGGQSTFRALADGPGDLNGDGFPDALLGVMEANVGGFRSGAVFVYAGGPFGLEATPARVLTWPEWQTEMAEDFTVADLDGDGLLDLLIGITRADGDRSAQGLPPNEDAGAVAIYPGVAGSFFAQEPSVVLFGEFGSDHFGKSLAVCDFNGDGELDLAVGARYADDRSGSPVVYNTGGIRLFLGDGTGLFADVPDQGITGLEPDGGGGWIPDGSQEMGFDIAAGDVDGDGICDLAVGSYNWASAADRTRDNLVTIWRGQSDASAGAPEGGGFLPWPVLAFAPVDPEATNGYFGREVKLDDLNGDGMADLIVGQFRYTEPTIASVYHGAARIYEGRALGTAPAAAITPASTQIWIHTGTNSYDYVGAQVDIADADGDGLLDLIVGQAREEGNGSPSNAGSLAVFLGRANDFPDTIPAYNVFGGEDDERLGVGLAALGDVDGDGVGDLFGFAAFGDLYGFQVGVPWFFSGMDDTNPPVALEYPGTSAGQMFGGAAAIAGDVNDDGWDDFLVGASELTRPTGYKTGAAYLYLGSASGFDAEPSVTLSGFTGNTNSDRIGSDVAPAADFDGDGIDDFAVLARYEDKPASFSTGWNDPGDCGTGSRNDAGAIYIFRGTAAGQPLVSEPSFIIYGPQTSQRLDMLEGGGDIDGDGLGDLLFGGYDWDRAGAANAGGFAAVLGRPYSGNGVDVICAYETILFGFNASYRLGKSASFIGDTDGDGCDELAVGAYLADWTASNEGAVHVLKGWGGSGCPTEPTQAILTPRDSNDQAGYSVGGGGDVDGDGIPDLAVGAPYFYGNGASRGSAWLVPGSWLNQLTYEPLDEDGTTTTFSLWPLMDSLEDDWRLLGTAVNGRLGWDVDIVPEYAGGRGLLAAGEPRGDLAGIEWSGGVELFEWSPGTGGIGRMAPVPVAIFTGEGVRDGQSGALVNAGLLNGVGALVVGAPRSDAQSVDQGAAWIVEIAP